MAETTPFQGQEDLLKNWCGVRSSKSAEWRRPSKWLNSPLHFYDPKTVLSKWHHSAISLQWSGNNNIFIYCYYNCYVLLLQFKLALSHCICGVHLAEWLQVANSLLRHPFKNCSRGVGLTMKILLESIYWVKS